VLPAGSIIASACASIVLSPICRLIAQPLKLLLQPRRHPVEILLKDQSEPRACSLLELAYPIVVVHLSSLQQRLGGSRWSGYNALKRDAFRRISAHRYAGVTLQCVRQNLYKM
jgi:hypothetical protein